jgi:hypothetical protein
MAIAEVLRHAFHSLVFSLRATSVALLIYDEISSAHQ